MRKKMIGLLLLSSIFSVTVYSQVKNESAIQNAYAQKMSDMFAKSKDVVLPDSVYTILKNIAFNTGISEKLAVKQAYILKMIYNTSFSKEDRILACDHILRYYSSPGNIIPLFLVTEMKNKLISSK
jgi:hypothetical protein